MDNPNYRENYECVKTFRKCGAVLRVYDLNISDGPKHKLAYDLRVNRRVIFAGKDFWAAAHHAIDGYETALTILMFLTLQRGDTDAEYFDNYTSEQFEFIDSEMAENLRFWINSREK